MNTIRNIAIVLAGALALTACDPYTKEKTGPGQILSVFTSSQTIATVDGVKGAGGAWTVSGVTDDGGSWPVVWVRFDKLLDGFSIQSTTTSCVPATGLGLAVTETTAGAAPPLCGAATGRAGLLPDWYACYVPNTAIAAEGGGVVFYLGCDDISSLGTGFNDNSTMQNGARYHITATVKDKQARSYPIDVTVETVPAAAVLTLGTATATSQPMSWVADPGTATYDVQRAPNAPTGTPPVDAAGTFATLAAGTGLTGTTFTDATVATGTIYWYRLVSHGTNGLSTTSGSKKATIP